MIKKCAFLLLGLLIRSAFTLSLPAQNYLLFQLDDCGQAAEYYQSTNDITFIITGNKELFDKPLDTFGPVTAVSMEIK